MTGDPRFSWLSLPYHQHILSLLAQNKGEGRFVGSAVRNSLLGLPIHDYDIATTHTPDQVESLLNDAMISVIPTGRRYGTLTAVLPECVYEITTLRQDIKAYGRHAEVAFTTNWEVDAARRDFTINALYLDAYQKIYDFYGGCADLEAGAVRFIGDPSQRLQEDYLRILRFFRFSAFYGKGPLDPQGLAACCALKENMYILSRERITYEFLRLLEAPNPWPLLSIMRERGILAPLSGAPDTCSLQDFQAQLTSMAFLESNSQPASPLIRFKSLFRDRETVPPRFRLSRARQKIWNHLNREGDVFLDFSYKLASQGLSESEGKALFKRALKRQNQEKETPFPLKGQDIVNLGIPPGKEVGDLLKRVRLWWKSQDPLPTHMQCLSYVKQQMGCPQKKDSATPQVVEET